MQILQIYIASTFLVAIGLAVFIFAAAAVRTWNSEPSTVKTTQAEQSELAWWVKINTAQPRCTYYFGPFASAKEAEIAQPGYVEDLEREGAQKITVQVEWCQPQELTLFA